jgi:hypothetical protein
MTVAERQRLSTIILATQQAEIRSSMPTAGKEFTRPYLDNTRHKAGGAEWLKW